MPKPRIRSRTTLLLTLLGSVACLPAAAIDQEADRLRHVGYAQLENEKPAEAETTFEKLSQLMAKDPLPWANLAIARLRQQEFPEAQGAIDKALQIAPGRGDLLAIRGEILQWSGKPQEALEAFQAAALAAQDDIEIQYSLLRQSGTVGESAIAARRAALERLTRLRPENLLVVLEAGQLAIADGDREEATRAFLRIGELLWQAPPVSERALDRVEQALNAGDVAAARIPAQQLGNVLKITPMYQQGLRELATGIQGIPLDRFEDEPASSSFGESVNIRFEGQRLAGDAVDGTAVAIADLDEDQRSDIAWIYGRDEPTIELWGGAGGFATTLYRGSTVEASDLRAIDLDNGGGLELVAVGKRGAQVLQTTTSWTDATEPFGLAAASGNAVAAIDFDIEGDLDLSVVGDDGALTIYRNSLEGALENVGKKSLPAIGTARRRAVIASDLDRDGDLDLVVAGDDGLTWLDNLRQGEFVDRSARAGLTWDGAAYAVASADLDNDGWPDLIAAGNGLFLFHNLGGRFEPWSLGDQLQTPVAFHSVVAFDADNDGRLDLAAAGPQSLVVLQQKQDGFRFVSLDNAPTNATDLAAGDLDGDGDVDLAVAGKDGLFRLTNQGGNRNGWLSIRLRGLTKGNSKNNVLGLGSTLELRTAGAYQFREVQDDVTHIGLGSRKSAELLRVVWTNGVPQNRFGLTSEQTIVEEQLLKGSCPFLYAWDGETVRFISDLLWGAPIGLPVADGVWAGADPGELVKIPRAAPRNGAYDLRVTEELWEAAFFDQLRLWVVDAPAALEVASNLKIVPGKVYPERVLATAALRPIVAAWDATGADVTERISARDDIYAGGWDRLPQTPYQGVSDRLWQFTFDLGEAPAMPIRLLLDGWIFPSDASLNLAVDQRTDLPPPSTRLEVETDTGWQTLLDPMGFPAGKTKTMVIDTPALPPRAHRLRIVTSRWLAWDRIVWSAEPRDEDAVVVAKLDPSSAELGFRGFSKLVRKAPNAPHGYDYSVQASDSPWLPFPGRYTRYGNVLELLLAADDRSVILGPGDEIQLLFDSGSLPPVQPGWERTVLLESQGWDKDADRNTYRGDQVFPLPFRAMTGYPYGDDERFPDSPEHRRYLDEWLVRDVPFLP